MSDVLPKTVIIGSTGFLGSTFLLNYRQFDPECLGTARKPRGSGIIYLDLLSPNIFPLKLAEFGCKNALILSAISGVDECEIEKELSRKINVDGTLELVRQLASEGIKSVFFSSDYVFNGNSGNYLDNDLTFPITEYGRQKADVESRIAKISNGNFLVVRLSKVFSLKKQDTSLLDEMAKIFVSGGVVRAAFDQVFCPTLITDLIKAVACLQINRTTGIVNVCSPEIWSRYDLALMLAKTMGIESNRVIKVSLDEIGFKIRRPKNTSLITKRLLSETKTTFTPITKCIDIVAKNWM